MTAFVPFYLRVNPERIKASLKVPYLLSQNKKWCSDLENHLSFQHEGCAKRFPFFINFKNISLPGEA